MVKAVEANTDQKWVVLYVKRWLKAPVQMPDGRVVERDRGTPQGSAVSPILANLFMAVRVRLTPRKLPGFNANWRVRLTSDEQPWGIVCAAQSRYREPTRTVEQTATRNPRVRGSIPRGPTPTSENAIRKIT